MTTAAEVRRALTALATLLALGTLTACSGDDETGGSAEPSAATSESTRASTGEYDTVPLEDYTYVLERQCNCPVTGEVEVTVAGGEAVSAVNLEDFMGTNEGDDAPSELLLTLNDLIAEANDPEMDSVEVAWPKDQQWPRSVYVDPDKNTPDDETFYLISDVQPS